MKNLVVLNAGLSNPSTTKLLAERITHAVEAKLQGDILVTWIDIRDYTMDLGTLMTSGVATEALSRAKDTVASATAIIAATPVFTSSYSGLFKMFLDALDPDSLIGTPVIIAATAGTQRHALMLDHAMRPVFTYLRTIVMPTGVFAAVEDFGANSGLDQRIERAACELASYMGHETEESEPESPAAPVDFRALLKGHDGEG